MFKVGDRVRYTPIEAGGVDWQDIKLTESPKKPGGLWIGIDSNNGEGAFDAEELELLPTASALDVQIGGDHYKTMPIQPMEYSMKNGLDACQHTIIKYVTRFREKGGIEDLEKAKHCIDLLIGFEKEKG